MKRPHILILVCSYWILVAFPTSHPITTSGGYTGAPLDSFCTTCHQDQNQNIIGDADILGLPPYVFKNETYPLAITVKAAKESAYRAGFQLVALESDLSNAGILINNSEFSVLKVAGGKRYLGHNPALIFNGDTAVHWQELWQIEENDEGTLTLYLAAMLGSGDQGNGNDRAIFKSFSTELRDSTAGVWATASITNSLFCAEATKATIEIRDYGGVSPIKFLWDTGDTSRIIMDVSPGTYHYMVTDALGNMHADSIVLQPNTREKIDSVEIIQNANQLYTVKVFDENITDVFVYFLTNEETSFIDSSQNAIFENIPGGNYLLYAQNDTGCTTDTLSVVLDVSTSTMDNLYPAIEIAIHPNPATDFILVSSSQPHTEYTITDLNGHPMAATTSQNNRIDISNLSSGIYILYVHAKNKSGSKLFIKI